MQFLYINFASKARIVSMDAVGSAAQEDILLLEGSENEVDWETDENDVIVIKD